MKTLAWLALASFLLLGSACSVTSRGYFPDRWRDLAGVFSFDIGTTKGLQAYAGISHVFQAGWGNYSGSRTGFRDGRYGSWYEERSEFGLCFIYLLEVDWEDRSEHLVGHQHARFSDPGFIEHPWQWGTVQADRTPGDIGVAGNLGFIGASASFHSLKFFDFLTGWFGLDLLGDNLGSKDEATLVAELGSQNAYVRLRAARHLALLTGNTNGYRSYSNPKIISKLQKEAIEDWNQTKTSK